MTKRKYVKPAVIAENFLISESVAVCSVQVNANSGACLPDDIKIFWEMDSSLFVSEFNCTQMVEITPGDYNGFCYHTFSDTKTLFQS